MRRPSWMLTAAAAALTLLLTGSVLLARPGTVKMKDGKSFDGDITETGNTVFIKTPGGTVSLRKDQVASVQYGEDAKSEFDKRLAELDPQDVAGRVKLARWAFDQKEYDLATDAADAALKIDPRNQEARDLRTTIQEQIRLGRRTAPEAPTPPPATPGQPARPGAPGAGAGAGGATGRGPTTAPAAAAQPGGQQAGARGERAAQPAAASRVVTPAEINRIRHLEWREGDNNIQVRIDPNLRRRFLDNNADYTPQQFNKLPPVEQARAILKSGSPEMAEQVTLASDPRPLTEYRRMVQQVILPGCASTQCHGGPGTSFVLHNPGKTDQQAYTNFLVLQEYQTSVNGAQRSMIDRTRPEDSLLLQYGLPRDVATVAHPEVKNFRPVFRGANDQRYRSVLAWVSDSLAPVKPDYDIDLSDEAADGDAREAAGAAARERGGRGGGADGAGQNQPGQPQGQEQDEPQRPPGRNQPGRGQGVPGVPGVPGQPGVPPQRGAGGAPNR